MVATAPFSRMRQSMIVVGTRLYGVCRKRKADGRTGEIGYETREGAKCGDEEGGRRTLALPLAYEQRERETERVRERRVGG